MSDRRPRVRNRRRYQTAWLERLEDRTLLATITVNTTADDTTSDATLSLREAIEVANGTLAVGSLSTQEQAQVSGALSNPNTIAFQIPGSGVQTITTATSLPAITVPVIIDGYTQPGASPNTNGPRAGDNAVLLIQVVGTIFPPHPEGLVIKAGGSTVRGLVLSGFDAAIDLQTNGGNTIAGNFIGTTADGTTYGSGNANITGGNAAGVRVESRNNKIGGTAPADRNLISGNSAGILFPFNPVADDSNNLIEGNLLGLDVTGTKAILGENGVLIGSGSQETIGGPSPAAGNVVSGNVKGIEIDITDVSVLTGHVIQGNIIGLDVTGTALVVIDSSNKGNELAGILVNDVGAVGTPPSNPLPIIIGGTAPGAGNVISGNSALGIWFNTFHSPGGSLIQGNDIGTDLSGTKNLGNASGGGGGGIRLGGPNHTVGGTSPGAGNVIAFNDPGTKNNDGVGIDPGSVNNVVEMNSLLGNGFVGILRRPQGLVADYPAPPVLTSVMVSVGNSTIQGTVTGPANDQMRVEFFANPSVTDAEGQTFLGFTTVTIGANGTGNFSASFPSSPTGPAITVTTTDTTPNSPIAGTSGFSNVFQASGNSPDLSLQGTAPSTVAQGSNVTYTLTVTNGGNATATGVTLTDTLPGNVTFLSATGGVNPVGGVLTFSLGSLAAASSAATITIVVAANSAGTLTNSAAVSGNETDATPADNSLAQATTVQSATAASADLALQGSAPASVTLGTNVTYTLTVANAGPSNATGVTLTDTLPGNVTFLSATGGVNPVGGVLTFSLGSLAAASSAATITIVVAANSAGTLTNSAAVSGNETDATPADNSLAQATTVQSAPAASADLALQGSAPASVTLGTNVTYTLTVANAGPSNATGVTLTDTLPAGAIFVSATGGIVPVNGVLTFHLGKLAANAQPVTETVVVSPVLTGVLKNAVSLSAVEPDATPGDNSLTETTAVAAVAVGGDGPVVESVQRYGIHAQPTVLVLTFNKSLDPGRAEDTSNYRIVGPHGQTIAVDSASYNEASRTVTLHPHLRLNIHRRYQFTVAGTSPHALTAITGLLLDGTRSGIPGSDYRAILDRGLLVLPTPHPRGR